MWIMTWDLCLQCLQDTFRGEPVGSCTRSSQVGVVTGTIREISAHRGVGKVGVDGKQKEGREEPRRSIVRRTETSWPGEEREPAEDCAAQAGRGVQLQESSFYPEDGSRFWLRERLAGLERGPQ